MVSQIVIVRVFFSAFVLLAGMIGLSRLARTSMSNGAGGQPRLTDSSSANSVAQQRQASPQKLRPWAGSWPKFRPTSMRS